MLFNNKKNNNSSNNTNTNESITFGKYYNNGSNLEPIEWIKLDEDGDKELLVTKYAIDSVPYNDEYKSVTWNNSSIRKWLNGEFYDEAFDDEEKSKILLTQNKASVNPNHKSSPVGKDTEDKVFLLSYDEVSKYFPNEEDRHLKPTRYAKENGCYTNSSGNVAWWTRSPGLTPTSPEYLASAGDFGIREHQVNENIIGTRPAIWVKK